MRYHHQIGAMKERKGIGKGKIAFLLLLVVPVVGYAGFLALLPGVGGWPVKDPEDVVNRVRTISPGSEGDKLFIPRLNVVVDLQSRDASVDGEFGLNKIGSISAERFAFGVTPEHILKASPFYRLDQLTVGDEFYIDFDGTRYAYKVSDSVSDTSHVVLKTKDENVAINAEPIGTVAWHNGEPRIETLQEETGPQTTDQIFEGEEFDPNAPVESEGEFAEPMGPPEGHDPFEPL